jgi:hypothetical protein
MLCCSTTTIDGLDIEFCSTKNSVLDIVHEISTKAGVIVNNFHYEDSGTATPPGAFIKIAQRGAGIRDMFTTFNTGEGPRYIHLLDVGSDYYFDGNTIKTASNSQVQLINIGGMAVKLGKGTTSSNIETTGYITSETDKADNSIIHMGNYGFMNSFRIITKSLKKMLWFSNDYTINFFDSDSKKLKVVEGSADMSLENNHGRIYLKSGNTAGTSDIKAYSNMFDIRKNDGSEGDYSAGYFRLSGHSFWVDSDGVFRMKKGYPSSDKDGVVVGSQG